MHFSPCLETWRHTNLELSAQPKVLDGLGRAAGHFLSSCYPKRGLSSLEREGVCVSLTWTGRLVGRGLASTPETGRLVPASGPGLFGFPPAGPGGLTYILEVRFLSLTP